MAKRARPTGSSLISDFLATAGVTWVYGIPVPQNVELWEAIRRSSLRPVVPASELSGGFMALGEALTTSRPAVTVVGPGPGLTHGLSALAEAYQGGVPLISIVTHRRTDVPYRFQLHDVDQEAVAAPLLKGTLRPERLDEIPSSLATAFRLATEGCPGPVAVFIPEQLLFEEGKAQIPLEPPELPPPARDPEHEAKILEAVRIIKSASNVGIYAGRGAAGAVEALAALAERLQAPVATTISGRGVLPDDHPLSVGFGYGPSGPAYSRRLFADRDLIITIGARYSEAATGLFTMPFPSRLIHVDVKAEHIGVNVEPELSILSDARLFLDSLTPRLEQAPRNDSLRDRIAKGKRKLVASLTRSPQEDGVQPEFLFARLRSRLPANATLVVDTGRHSLWALHAYQVQSYGGLVAPVDYQSPGSSLPTALGIKLANPERRVVSLCGDEGFLVSGMALRTAADGKLAVPLLVLEDKPSRGKTPRGIDYRAMAQALGARTVTIESDYELDEGLDAALARTDRPTLCHVRILHDRPAPYLKGAMSQQRGRLTLALRARSLARRIFRR